MHDYYESTASGAKFQREALFGIYGPNALITIRKSARGGYLVRVFIEAKRDNVRENWPPFPHPAIT
jgi:hypothetical protein